jgi:hypothetical protein
MSGKFRGQRNENRDEGADNEEFEQGKSPIPERELDAFFISTVFH